MLARRHATGCAKPQGNLESAFQSAYFGRSGRTSLEEGVRNLPASVEARASICAQSRDGRAQVGFRGVPEFSHQRVSFERLLHDAPLNPFAPSVNEPYLTETGVVCGVHVFLDDGLDLAGRERMTVGRVFYRS